MSDRGLVFVTRMAVVWKGKSPSPEWVDQRAKLMESVNIPAMSAIGTPFWWVWRTAKNRQDQVQEIASRIWPEAIVVTNEATHEAVAPDHKKVLTFRLDSDDVWIPEEVDRWAQTDLAPSTLINFAYGWQLDWSDRRIGNFQWLDQAKQGPFLALTHDSRAKMLGVGGNHATEARSSRKNVQHVKRRSWVQVVHGDNIRNGWRAHTPFDTGDDRWRTVVERSSIVLP